MADDIKVTVRGRVATQPVRVESKNGTFTRFRLAHTPRIFDQSRGTWTDGRTEWFSVILERESLQSNAQFSVHKGIPVIVVGRLRTTAWRDGDQERWSMAIRAETVGIDLAFGIGSFARMRPAEQPGAEAIAELAGQGTDQEEDRPSPESDAEPAAATG